jgi:receptor expression-enhancing protein 5/6
VYCFAPTKWNGSLTIYTRVIRPFVLKHQKKIDEAMGKATEAAKSVIDEGTSGNTLFCWLNFQQP